MSKPQRNCCRWFMRSCSRQNGSKRRKSVINDNVVFLNRNGLQKTKLSLTENFPHAASGQMCVAGQNEANANVAGVSRRSEGGVRGKGLEGVGKKPMRCEGFGVLERRKGER